MCSLSLVYTDFYGDGSVVYGVVTVTLLGDTVAFFQAENTVACCRAALNKSVFLCFDVLFSA